MQHLMLAYPHLVTRGFSKLITKKTIIIRSNL